LALGAFSGLVLGIFVLLMPPGTVKLQLVTIPFTTVDVALVGAWIASLAGAPVLNSRLKLYQDDIASGNILLMVDVPTGRAEWLHGPVLERHPEAKAQDNDSPTLAFPQRRASFALRNFTFQDS